MVAQQQLVIITHHPHGITELRLNRPEARNAFSKQLYQITTCHLKAISNDPKTRIILLTGTGETFCAGMDIKEASSTNTAKESIKAAKQFMLALLSTPKIVCAAVSGPIVGIGVTLLLHCDFVFASHRTTFTTPFPDVGLVPEFGASVTFPLWLGRRRAAELLLMGRVLGVEDMDDLLVTVHGGRREVVSSAKQVLTEWSKRMGDLEWRAVEMGKERMALRVRNVVKEAVDEEIETIEALVESGVTAKLMRKKVATLAKL